MSKLPPIYDILKKGEEHLAKPEVQEANKKAVEEFKKKNAMPPSNQSSKGGRKSTISSKFNRCVKSVRKTVRARKGSTKESAAIGICTKSVLQKRGRTMKRYRKGRLVTQKKFRGGATPQPEPQGFGLFRRGSVPEPPVTWQSIAQGIETSLQAFGFSDNRMTDLEERVHGEILNVSVPMTERDRDYVTDILSFAIEADSKRIIQALHAKGVSKQFMLTIFETLLEPSADVSPGFRTKLQNLQPTVTNLEPISGGATVEEEDQDPDAVPPRTWESIAGKLQLNTRFFGHNTNLMNNLEQTVIDEIRNVTSNATVDDIDNIIIILNFAIQKKSKKIIEALHARGVGKDTILMILDRLVEDPENARFRENIETLRPFVANLS